MRFRTNYSIIQDKIMKIGTEEDTSWLAVQGYDGQDTNNLDDF